MKNLIEENSLYLAKPDFVTELKHELVDIKQQLGDLFLAAPNQSPVFAIDCWHHPKLLTIKSIGDAVKQLKSIQAFWYLHPIEAVRRSLLIKKQLPTYKKFDRLSFPIGKLIQPGVFTLLDNDTLIYSTERDKLAPDGHFNFVEDKQNPPNRAYLKLWEALTLLGRYPKLNDFAVDLGASPGGWTYVLSTFGANVVAIDKAPLAETISQLPNVSSKQLSAFSLQPKDFSAIDWFVCDVACYPQRLYEWLQPWLASNKVKQFIVTLKLQGDTDFSVIQKFKAIPNSKVLQLYHNKHEVTFIYPWK